MLLAAPGLPQLATYKASSRFVAVHAGTKVDATLRRPGHHVDVADQSALQPFVLAIQHKHLEIYRHMSVLQQGHDIDIMCTNICTYM